MRDIVPADIMSEISKRLSSIDVIENLRKSGVGSTDYIKASIFVIDDFVHPSELLETMVALDESGDEDTKIRPKYPNLSKVNILIDEFDELLSYMKLIEISRKLKNVTIRAIDYRRTLFTEKYMNIIIRSFEKLDRLKVIYKLDDDENETEYDEEILILETSKNNKTLDFGKRSVILEVHNYYDYYNSLFDVLKDLGVDTIRIQYYEEEDLIIHFINNLIIHDTRIYELVVGTKENYTVDHFDNNTYILMTNIIDLVPTLHILTAEDGRLFSSPLFEEDDTQDDKITLIRTHKNKINFFSSDRQNLEQLFSNAIIEVLIPHNLDIDFYFTEEYNTLDSLHRYTFISEYDINKFIQPHKYTNTLNLRDSVMKFKDDTYVIIYPELLSFDTYMILNEEELELLIYVVDHMIQLKKITLQLVRVNLNLQIVVDFVGRILNAVNHIDDVSILIEDGFDLTISTIKINGEKRRLIEKFPTFLIDEDSRINVPSSFLKDIDGVIFDSTLISPILREYYLSQLQQFITKYNIRTLYIKTFHRWVDTLLLIHTIEEVIIDLRSGRYKMDFNKSDKFPHVKKVLILGNIRSGHNRIFLSLFPNATIE